MKKIKFFGHFLTFLVFGFLTITLHPAEGVKKESLMVKGLSEPVEIIKDQWGISHIYAHNEKDLFFAQGFNIARDRLFQLEIWRRQATGTMAEIQSSKALKRDIGSRLLKARVDMKQEMNHYHPLLLVSQPFRLEKWKKMLFTLTRNYCNLFLFHLPWPHNCIMK